MDEDTARELAYFHERERAERLMAEQAPSETIRQIHLDLAERYRRLADFRDGQLPD